MFAENGQELDLWSWETLGLVATTIAVMGGVISTWHWSRARWQRHTLKTELTSLEGANDALVRLAVRMSRALIASVPWEGWRMPSRLAECLEPLDNTIRELEHTTAKVRGMRAEAAVAPLREDIEAAAATLRQGSILYRDGALALHRELRGEAYSPAKDGQDALPALGGNDADVSDVKMLAEQLELHVRSSWYQAGEASRAKAFSARWPTRTWQVTDGPWKDLDD